MAATGVRRAGRWATAAGLLFVAFGATPILQADGNQGQGNQEIRNLLSDITIALAAGNPSNAIEPFDKSFNDYQKLSDYFSALTSAYQVASELEVTDEQDSGNDALKMSVRWTLHLTDAQSNDTQNRSAELTLQAVRRKGKWKIVDLKPLDIFNPQQRSATAQPGRLQKPAQLRVGLPGD